MQDDAQQLQLELALALQQTEEVVPTFPAPGENIDSQWSTYGAGLGLLYRRQLGEHLRFVPSLWAWRV